MTAPTIEYLAELYRSGLSTREVARRVGRDSSTIVKRLQGAGIAMRSKSEANTKDVHERFWSKVDRSGGPDACWPWTGARNSDGYGHISIAGRLVPAHRCSYELKNGPIPAGLFICHKCDNPPCVNPGHLFPGSNSDNIADAARKGRLHRARGEQHPVARLTEQQVREIRERVARGEGQAAVARAIGIGGSAVHSIVHRQGWRHVA